MKRRATKTEDRSKSSAKARLAASRPEEESEQAKKRRTELIRQQDDVFGTVKVFLDSLTQDPSRWHDPRCADLRRFVTMAQENPEKFPTGDTAARDEEAELPVWNIPSEFEDMPPPESRLRTSEEDENCAAFGARMRKNATELGNGGGGSGVGGGGASGPCSLCW